MLQGQTRIEGGCAVIHKEIRKMRSDLRGWRVENTCAVLRAHELGVQCVVGRSRVFHRARA